jgi:hypothetical protein
MHMFSLQIALTCVSLAAIFAGVPSAQLPQDGRDVPAQPAEVTISGEVHKVMKHSMNGQAEVHLLVTVDHRDVEVHLAPGYYLSWHQFQLRSGDRVEIAARKAVGESHFLARTIKSGSRSLTLRDQEYRPLWKKGQK